MSWIFRHPHLSVMLAGGDKNKRHLGGACLELSLVHIKTVRADLVTHDPGRIGGD